MTAAITDIVSGVVSAAKAKIDATEAKAAGFIPQIIDAHQKVLSAERIGHRQSLDCAIAAGELLLAAKEAARGLGRWSDWRSGNGSGCQLVRCGQSLP